MRRKKGVMTRKENFKSKSAYNRYIKYVKTSESLGRFKKGKKPEEISIRHKKYKPEHEKRRKGHWQGRRRSQWF